MLSCPGGNLEYQWWSQGSGASRSAEVKQSGEWETAWQLHSDPVRQTAHRGGQFVTHQMPPQAPETAQHTGSVCRDFLRGKVSLVQSPAVGCIWMGWLGLGGDRDSGLVLLTQREQPNLDAALWPLSFLRVMLDRMEKDLEHTVLLGDVDISQDLTYTGLDWGTGVEMAAESPSL